MIAQTQQPFENHVSLIPPQAFSPGLFLFSEIRLMTIENFPRVYKDILSIF